MQPYYKRSIQGSSKDQKRSWGHNPSSSRRRRKPPLLQPLATPYPKYLPNHTNKELWNKFSSANQTALDLQLFISNTSSISTTIPNPKIYPTTQRVMILSSKLNHSWLSIIHQWDHFHEHQKKHKTFDTKGWIQKPYIPTSSNKDKWLVNPYPVYTCIIN